MGSLVNIHTARRNTSPMPQCVCCMVLGFTCRSPSAGQAPASPSSHRLLSKRTCRGGVQINVVSAL